MKANQVVASRRWEHPSLGGCDLFKARFQGHRYDLHTHGEYVVALITDGCERVRIGRSTVLAEAGAIFVVNPEEWHDGESGSDRGWAYRTLYPSVSLINEICGELGQEADPVFPGEILRDRALATAFARAHQISETSDHIDGEVALLDCFRRLVIRHADRKAKIEPLERSGASRRLEMYAEVIDSHLSERIELQQLAVAAGVTRFQVIRDFKNAAGPTPTAFIRDRRLRKAVELVKNGARLVDAAALAGFSDQSHLSRTFRRAHGHTIGSLARAGSR